MPPDESDENPVLAVLLARLSPKPRASVARRYDAMIRELRFLHDRQDPNLRFIRSRKWSDVRLRALFAVNSIYQEVLGPQQALAKGSAFGLGRDLPILHGSIRFDSAHTSRVDAALEDFFGMIATMGFRREWMSKNTCGDLVYFIAQFERDAAPSGDAG